MVIPSMVKENITITLDGDMLDSIRKLAEKNYRSINKQIAFMLNIVILQANESKEKQNGK
jgi:hypothetical protein